MWFSKAKAEPKPAFFVWSEADHSVGVKVFDEEHQRLTAMMSQIHDALLEEHDRLRALQLMERLVQETRAHFAHEERSMEEAQYPDLEAHAAEHAALITRAHDMLRQFRMGSVSAMMFPAFLRDWLVPHIQLFDRKYSAALRRKGLR
jgi:hemerythrin-like metal-binding protein